MTDKVDTDLKVAAQLFLSGLKEVFGSEHPFTVSAKPNDSLGTMEIMLTFNAPVPHFDFLKSRRAGMKKSEYVPLTLKMEEPVEVKEICFQVFNMDDTKKFIGPKFRFFGDQVISLKDKKFGLMILGEKSKIEYNKKIPKNKKLTPDLSHASFLWKTAIGAVLKPFEKISAHEYMKLLAASLKT